MAYETWQTRDDPVALHRTPTAKRPIHYEVETLPFYRVMRWLERVHQGKPRAGHASHPGQEGYRLRHHITASFQANECQSFVEERNDVEGDGTSQHHLVVNLMGLLGTQGPLPFFITERVIRAQASGELKPFVDFLDLFHHRLLMANYAIWAQAQPIVQRERPTHDRYGAWISHLAGHVRPHYATPLSLGPSAMASKGLEQLRDVVAATLNIRLQIEEWVGDWYDLPQTSRTCLGLHNGHLNRSAVLGRRLYSRSFKVRFHVRELTLEQYLALLPSGPNGQWLAEQLEQTLPATLDWEIGLSCRQDQWLNVGLGRSALGRNSWLGMGGAQRVKPVVLASDAYAAKPTTTFGLQE